MMERKTDKLKTGIGRGEREEGKKEGIPTGLSLRATPGNDTIIRQVIRLAQTALT